MGKVRGNLKTWRHVLNNLKLFHLLFHNLISLFVDSIAQGVQFSTGSQMFCAGAVPCVVQSDTLHQMRCFEV